MSPDEVDALDEVYTIWEFGKFWGEVCIQIVKHQPEVRQRYVFLLVDSIRTSTGIHFYIQASLFETNQIDITMHTT